MLWLLHKLSSWMNRPYDFTEELERLRREQRGQQELKSEHAVEKPSPRAEARSSIAKAVRAAEAAYWSACDAEGKAIRPSTLGAPTGLLDEAYDIALEAELLVADKGFSWDEARKRV
jgi:hypothetical protein